MRSEKALVSIIVPAYNVGKYIEECVSSLLKQTYGNIEVIIVDDGSIDNTYSLCQKMKKNDSRIKLFTQMNSGVSESRNVGIQHAVGDYIMFVDGDDRINTNCVELMVNSLEDDDSLVIGRYSFFWDDGTEQLANESLSNCPCLKGKLYDEYLKPILVDQTILGSACRILFPKALLDNAHICFPNCVLSEDQVFLVRVLKNVKKINAVDESVYFYRMNSNSATHKKYRNKFRADREIYFTALIDAVNNIELSEKQFGTIYKTILLRNRKILFFNAALSEKYKEEYKEIKESCFYKEKTGIAFWFGWFKNLSILDKAVAILMQIGAIKLMRKIRLRNQ